MGEGLAGGALRVWYHSLTLPPGVPDALVFGPVRAGLYVLTGWAAWLVWRRSRMGRLARVLSASGLRLWGWQLLCNAAWVPAFFGLRSPLLGLIVLLLVIGLTGATMWRFARVWRPACWLMLPYLVWACVAAYLDAGILWLNPSA